MRALVIFGSKSDEKTYTKVLEECQIADLKLSIISAHREPIKLGQCLTSEDYDFVIAGAGLAAHLPGVIASQTLKPVFGIPVANQFSGL